MDNEQINALKAPLDKSCVKQRSQAGRSLSYVEAWHCISEANRIFGFDGWSRETVENNLVWSGEVNGKPACTYVAKVRVVALGIGREGTGVGHGVAKNPGDAHESAVKEAESDAMKRALMTFGNPFGLALYDKDQKEVVEAPKWTPEQRNKADGAIAAISAQTASDGLKTLIADIKPEVDALPEALKQEVRAAFKVKSNELKGNEDA